MPFVSVIIPTYNRAHLLRATLDSVLAQGYGDYELVVVDDGSRDDTPASLTGLGKRIVYRSIAHQGPCVARNVGLQIAQGETIAFLDSDDLWRADFLQKMVGALRAAPHTGFVYCDYELFDDKGPIRTGCLRAADKIRGNLFPRLLQRDFLCMGALLIRRECLLEVGGFDPALPLAHDWELWLRLARRYEAEYLNEPLLCLRQHPGQHSRNDTLMESDNLRVLARLRRRYPQEVAPYREVLRLNAIRAHRALASYYRQKRRPLPALWHLLQMAAARFG